MTTKQKKEFVVWLKLFVTPATIHISESDIIKKLDSYDTDVDNEIDYDAIKNRFHTLCPSLPKLKSLNARRKSSINARLSEFSLDDIYNVFTIAETSNFLSGRESYWKANFDWLLNPTNFLKVIEGNYLNKGESDRLNIQDGAPVGHEYFNIQWKGETIIPTGWKSGIPYHKNLAMDILLKKKFNGK